MLKIEPSSQPTLQTCLSSCIHRIYSQTPLWPHDISHFPLLCLLYLYWPPHCPQNMPSTPCFAYFVIQFLLSGMLFIQYPYISVFQFIHINFFKEAFLSNLYKLIIPITLYSYLALTILLHRTYQGVMLSIYLFTVFIFINVVSFVHCNIYQCQAHSMHLINICRIKELLVLLNTAVNIISQCKNMRISLNFFPPTSNQSLIL